MASFSEQEAPLLLARETFQLENEDSRWHSDDCQHPDLELASDRPQGIWHIPKVAHLRAVLLQPLAFVRFRIHGAQAKSFSIPTTLRSIFNYPEPGLKLRDTAWLDGLRGLAAFEVFLCHYLDYYWPIDKAAYWGRVEDGNNPSWYYLPMIRTFWLSAPTSVNIFFAISGYVLSHRMLMLMRQEQHDKMWSALSSAIFRRGIRLFGPVLAMSFFFMVATWFGLPRAEGFRYDPAPTFFQEFWRWITSFVHMLMPLQFPAGWPGIEKLMVWDGGISWTIPWEYYGSLQVYMAVLLLAYVPRYIVRTVFICIWVTFWFIRDDWVAAQFLLGMAFADYQIHMKAKNKKSRWSSSHTVICSILFILGWYVSGIPAARRIDNNTLRSRPGFDWISPPASWYVHLQADRMVQCLGAMLCMVAIGELSLLKKCLEWRPVQYLGRISFGLYLCHIGMRPCLRSLAVFIFQTLGIKEPKVAGSIMVVAWILWIIPAALLDFFVAGLFQRMVDDPSVQLGKTLERWSRKSQAYNLGKEGT